MVTRCESCGQSLPLCQVRKWRLYNSATFPIRTESELNKHDGWRCRARRSSATKGTIKLILRTSGLGYVPGLATKIVLTRIAPCALDVDNLHSALKASRDAVAEWFGFESDRESEALAWECLQEKGGVRQYGVRVEVFVGDD